MGEAISIFFILLGFLLGGFLAIPCVLLGLSLFLRFGDWLESREKRDRVPGEPRPWNDRRSDYYVAGRTDYPPGTYKEGDDPHLDCSLTAGATNGH